LTAKSICSETQKYVISVNTHLFVPAVHGHCSLRTFLLVCCMRVSDVDKVTRYKAKAKALGFKDKVKARAKNFGLKAKAEA